MTSPEPPARPGSVAITGASGFLGARTVALFRELGWNVLPVARRAGAEWQQVQDYSQTPLADVLIHLAEDGDRRRVNEAGSIYGAAAQNTFAELLEKGYRRVIYASSAALYGDSVETPRKTSEAVTPSDAYARAKLANEKQVLEHGGTALRFSNLYGPGMSPANVVSAILRQIPGKGEVLLWNDAPIRDFLWVDDATAALVAAATSADTGLFNVGTGSGLSIRQLAGTALSLAGEGERAIRSENPSVSPSTLILDIGETTRRIGWKPITSTEEGMGHLITRLTKHS